MNSLLAFFGTMMLATAALGSLAIAPGDSTSCDDISVPYGGAGESCTAKVTTTEGVPSLKNPCHPANPIVITVVMVCSSTSCTRHKTVCPGNTGAFEFKSASRVFEVKPGDGKKWGDHPTGAADCDDLKVDYKAPVSQ